MGKRIAIILVILLVSGLAIMGYFLQQGRKKLFTDPYKAISPDACVVIETVDIKSFMNSLTTGRGLFGEVGKVKELDRFNQELKYLADLLNKQNFKKLFNEGAAIISFQADKKGRIVPMVSMPVSGDIRPRHIKDMLSSSGIKQVTETKLNGNSVIEVPFNSYNREDTTYISLISGLMVFSNSKPGLKKHLSRLAGAMMSEMHRDFQESYSHQGKMWIKYLWFFLISLIFSGLC